MNIALVFGSRSEKIKDRMVKLRDDLYIDTYQSINDLIHGSQVRNKVYDRVLILSRVLVEDTDLLLGNLYEYWRRFALSSEFVLFANMEDAELAKKFNAKMCSPVCTSVLVSNVSVVILEELTALSVQELSTKYGCEEEANLELEVDSYDEPPVEQPNIIQKPQKKGLLSRIFGGKKKGTEVSNKEAVEGTTDEAVAEVEPEGAIEDYVEQIPAEGTESDSYDVTEVAQEEVANEDVTVENHEGTPNLINDSDFEENYALPDMSKDFKSSTVDYGNIGNALSKEIIEPACTDSSEDTGVPDSGEFDGGLTVDNFSELTTTEFSSDDEFNTEDGFDSVVFEDTEEFEFIPTISQDTTIESETALDADSPVGDELITADEEISVLEDSTGIEEQISENVLSEDIEPHAIEELDSQEDSETSFEGTTAAETYVDEPNTVSEEPIVDNQIDAVSDITFGVPSGEEVSEEFSTSDMLIEDTSAEHTEALVENEEHNASEQFSFNMPDTMPAQTALDKKPSKNRKRGLSSLFNRKNRTKVAEVSADRHENVTEQTVSTVPDGDVVYTPVNSEPQHPHVNDSDETILEENLFGGIDVAELEDTYRKDEQAKNTIVERIEVDKDENRVFNNVINGKHKAVFLITGDRGSGLTTFAYALAQEFAKHTRVLYYDGDTDNHGILNYIDLNRFCEYEDIKQQGNKNSRNLSAFKRCVIQYANNFDLLSSLYGTKVTDVEYETVQSVVSDASDDYNVVVADIPLSKLHLCQELIATANVIMMTEPTRRGMMNLACSFDNCELPLKYKRRIAASGTLLYSYKIEPNDMKKLKKTISDIVGFDENESNWLNMKTLVRDEVNMQFINELLG